MANPVGWFEIYVDDMQRTKKFYEGVFQRRLTQLESPNIEMWGFPLNTTQPGASGSLVHSRLDNMVLSPWVMTLKEI